MDAPRTNATFERDEVGTWVNMHIKFKRFVKSSLKPHCDISVSDSRERMVRSVLNGLSVLSYHYRY